MSRKLTRLTLIILITGLAVVVAACGGATQQAAAPKAAAPTTAPAAAPTTAPAAAPTTAPAAAPKATEAPKAAAPAATTAPTTAAAPKATDAPKAATTAPAAAAPANCNYDYRVTAAPANEAKQLTGAGATFPQTLYTRWFSDYNKLTGVQVNYQGVGSSAGIRQISEQTVDFGATDAPMTADQEKAAKGGAIFHVPTAAGAVVVTYNLAGVTQPLKLSSETVAGIYLGNIKTWNDPKIAAENAGVTLPSGNIVVVRRSDGSGTTNAFTEWLSVTNAEWKQKIGQGTTVNWPVGIGAQGNAGVAGEVKNNPNSIGYVEEIYASQNKLPKALIKNKAGKYIEPNLQTVTAALDASLQTIPADLKFTIIDAPGDNSYPVSTPTWILAYENMTDQAKAAALARVLWWGVTDGEKINQELGFAPLPAGMVKLAQNKICSIKVNGQQVFTGK